MNIKHNPSTAILYKNALSDKNKILMYLILVLYYQLPENILGGNLIGNILFTKKKQKNMLKVMLTIKK